MALNEDKEAPVVTPPVNATGPNRHDRRKEAAVGKQIPTPLTSDELFALTNMQGIARNEEFKAMNFAGNSALLGARGQEIAKEQESIARLMRNVCDQSFNTLLKEHGYDSNKRYSLDMKTGEVMEVEVKAAPETEAPKEAEAVAPAGEKTPEEAQ